MINSEMQHVFLDSSDGTAISSEQGNVTISLPDALKIKKVLFTDCTVPISWYNITSANNIISFKDTSAVSKTATLTAKNYTASQLATAIAAAMNAAGGTGTYASSYDTQTGKFTINETSGPTNFQLLFSSGSTAQPLSVIGFAATDLSGAATYTGGKVANVSGPNYIMVVSRALNRGVNESIFLKKSSATILKIPVNLASGSTISYVNSLENYTIEYPSRITIKDIDLQLQFPDGTQVGMNGVPWSLSFIAYP